MRNCIRPAAITLVLTAALLCAATAAAQQEGQDAAPPAPPPPELQRLVELAKDPERLRAAMSDPAKIQEMMNTMESDAVRQFMSDPRRVQQLMREIDPQQIQEAMRAVDFSKVRQAAEARWKAQLKRQLGVTDAEWAALEPKIDGVVRAQQEARPQSGGGGGRFGFGIGGGGGRGFPLAPRPGAAAGPSKAQEAAADLRETMDDPDASGGDVRRKLAAYRRERDKAREKLETSERELKELLTQRQEGILVMAGLLS